jgi:hypothetical protein
MPIAAECQFCGYKGNVPDQFKGKKVKCRQCQKLFVVGGDPAAAKAAAAKKSNPELVEMEIVEEAPARKGGRPGSSHDTPTPFTDLDSPAPAPKKGSAQISVKKGSAQIPVKKGSAQIPVKKGSAQVPVKKGSAQVPVQRSAPRGPFKKKQREPVPAGAMILGGVAAVLGGAALAVSSFGLIGLLSVPLGGLGLLLAIGGVVMAWGRPGLGVLAPVAGLLVSLGSLPVAGYHTYQLIASGALSSKEKSTAPGIAENGDTRPGAQATRPASDTRPDTRQGPPTTQPYKPPPPSGERVEAGRGAFVITPISVRVTRVEVDFVRGKDPKDVSKEKRLLVHIEMENSNQDENANYDGWGSKDLRGADGGPSLADNQGNKYARVLFEPGMVKDQQIFATIQPRRVYKDVIVFETPNDRVLFLELDLPANFFEAPKSLNGAFKFKIPKAMLLGKLGPPEKDPVKELPKDLPKYIADQLAALKKPLAPERINALNNLAELGLNAAPAAAEIAKYLRKDGIEQVRAAAAFALGKIGPAAKDQIPDLTAALKDEFFKVKANAAEALGNMGPLAKDALPELFKLVDSKEEEVPTKVKRAILKIDPKAKLPPPPKK